MTTVFEGAPKFGGISAGLRVTAIEDRVLIRAIDAMAEEAVTIVMTPDQARARVPEHRRLRQQPLGHHLRAGLYHRPVMTAPIFAASPAPLALAATAFGRVEMLLADAGLAVRDDLRAAPRMRADHCPTAAS